MAELNLPWTVADDRAGYREDGILDCKGKPIITVENDGCESDPGYDYLEIAYENKAFIVRAANSHHKLVAACETALKVIGPLPPDLERLEAMETIQQALAGVT